MSTDGTTGQLTDRRPADRSAALLTYRLPYLLKLAFLRAAGLAGAALAPYRIDLRELAVLAPLAGPDALSQQQLAVRLGIDRTTMVTVVDGLEGKGLVEREPHPADRRKNIVRLTAAGRAVLPPARRAAEEAEREFLAALSGTDADRLPEILRALLAEPADQQRS